MGFFYLYSLTELLGDTFDFSVDYEDLKIGMILSSSFICVSNFLTKFLPTKERYLNDNILALTTEQRRAGTLSGGFYVSIFIELLSSLASIKLLYHYSDSYLVSLSLGILSLLISLPAIYQNYMNQSALQTTGSTSCHLNMASWINVNARINKSGILLLAAVWKLEDLNLLEKEMGLFNAICFVFVFGGPIGINKVEMDQPKLSKHIKYISKKMKLGHCFGKISCCFYPAAQYPPNEKEMLENILHQRI